MAKTESGLTAQQELFARLVAEGKSQSAAYREAYPRSNNWKQAAVHNKASALAGVGEVEARVAQLRKEFAPKSILTLEKHIEELERLKELALAAGKFEAAITAEVNRGKACGIYVTKTEDVTDPMRKALGRMNPEKLDSVIGALDAVKAIREKAKSAT